MEAVFLDHFARYPAMRPRDAVKLAYQSEFGGGHMIPDADMSLARLITEIAQTPQTGGTLLEPIGGGLHRLYLRAIQNAGLRPETVNGLFLKTAAEPRGSTQGLEKRLIALERITDAGKAPFAPADLRAYLARYREEGCPAVSHSPEYRALYAPAYRLVPAETAVYLPLFREIDERVRRDGRVRVAIDGMSGSGKSTLGALIAFVYSAALFHMDEYFLPEARKTPERLAEPGGNVDRERFFTEIGSVPTHSDVVYRPFDCAIGALSEPVRVSANPIRVVEGSYSLHPALAEGYDLRVCLRIDPKAQERRILLRNGPEMLEHFLTEWIPLENAYIQETRLPERCDFVFDAADPE